MNSKHPPAATSGITDRHVYRRVGWLERLGTAAGAWFGAGPGRDFLRAVYRKALWWRTGGRGVRCDFPGGEQLRILPEHRPAWNPIESAGFKSAIRPGATVLDIGANIGTYSLLFGKWVGPDGKVFAFEPAPESLAALKQHIDLNGLEEVVVPVPLAISDRVGVLSFHAESTHGTNRLISDAEADAGTPTQLIETLTIDEFCARRQLRPDMIKIDIEGFELAALRGAERTLRAGRGELTVFVEMHPTTWKTLGLKREDIVAELDRQGFAVEPLVPPEGDPWLVEGVCMKLIPKRFASDSV